jgi:hypothetical protein
MTERNSTNFRKENGNVTVAADDLVQLLNTWTFDSSRDEENFVVPGEDSNAKHSYRAYGRSSCIMEARHSTTVRLLG